MVMESPENAHGKIFESHGKPVSLFCMQSVILINITTEINHHPIIPQ